MGNHHLVHLRVRISPSIIVNLNKGKLQLQAKIYIEKQRQSLVLSHWLSVQLI